jgi:amidase
MSQSSPTELWRFGAARLAELIRAKKASSHEVVGAHLARIGLVNPKVNAIVNVLGEEALRSADAADRQIASGASVGPLHGVPITVKENIDVLGSPTTQGTVSLAHDMPDSDSPQVAQLRAAGAIVMARTNLPEFALRWHTDNDLHGATVNPWNPAVTPGGSSGGEAVSIATGMSPLGLGNDDGGSLRYPSQCVGITTIKPGLGRVPRALSNPSMEATISSQLLNGEGPLAREVADVRLALGLMIRDSWRDPWHVPFPLEGPLRNGTKRVAVVAESALGKVSPQVSGGIAKAVKILEAAGYSVDEAAPPNLEEVVEVWSHMFLWDLRLGWDALAPLLSIKTRTSMEAYFGWFAGLSATQHMESFRRRVAIGRRWAEFQQGGLIVLGPVSSQPPFKLGSDVDMAGLRIVVDSMRLVVAANLMGLPAAVVPVGVQDGLPQAVQIIGPRYAEDLCLDVAAVLEAGVQPITPFDPGSLRD